MTDPAQVQHVIVMGVSGVGKTMVAQGLAELTGQTFAEGDDFHSEANVAKMHAGHALTDEDRWPWLRSIGDWMSEKTSQGRSSVVTCSALASQFETLASGALLPAETCPFPE